MLGFRGHYSTRSRRYSTTLAALRQARRDWRDQRLRAGRGYSGKNNVTDAGDETILVIGEWQYIGRGHSPGEAIFARTIARDLSENRRLTHHIRSEPEEAQ
jgi:hypothetical protein